MSCCPWFTALAVCCVFAAAVPSQAEEAAGKIPVYVGTYTFAKSKGIYLCHLDTASGKLDDGKLVAETPNPTYLAVHPNGKWLYTVNEVCDFAGGKTGSLSAFAIDAKTGGLKLLNQKSSGGEGPCHVMLDRDGKCALVANYVGGSVACLPILPDGSLGEATAVRKHEGSSVNKQRQEGPHAHGFVLDPTEQLAIVADLGIDRLMIYRFDAAKGSLEAGDPAFIATKPGAGPRHLVFHPTGRFLYAVNELDSTVTVYGLDAKRGAASAVASVSTLPEGFTAANSTAELSLHPSGKFLYASNRGHDSLAIFAVEEGGAKLRLVGVEPTQGKAPRHFVIDPSGKFLLAANQDGNNVVVFRIDPATGKLQATGSQIELSLPVCVITAKGK